MYPLVAGSQVTNLTHAIVEEVISINLRQADVRHAQSGVSRWWSFIVDTVVHGGPGYCLRSTLEEHHLTRPLLARIDASIAKQDLDLVSPPDRDVVHMDLSGDNMLVDEAGQIVAIIDWDGARFGDRAFDLVSLAASSAARGSTSAVDRLWDVITDITTPVTRLLYASHLAIRHVDWALRYGGDVEYEWNHASTLLDRIEAL